MQSKIIEGFVLGRVDFTGSMGLGREDINSEEVLNYAKNFCKIMNDHNLAAVVGGGISKDSHDFLKTLNDNFSLSSFETRKFYFGQVSNKNYKECLI